MNPLYFVACDNLARPRRNQPAGSAAFSDREISLMETAGGAVLRLGYTLHLVHGVHVSISGIAAEVAFVGRQSPSPPLPLGIAVDPCCHVIDTDHEFSHGGMRQFIIKGQLQMPLSLAALELAERRRDGAPPEFAVTLHASALVQNNESGHYDVCRLQVHGSSHDAIQLRADRDNWIQQVRKVSPIGSVLVEIPLTATREPPWDRVWCRLENAKANIALGGEMGWKNCVSEVRQALDAWRSIEKFESGGAQNARRKDKRQRLLDTASSFFHYCSLSVHADEHQTDWTRADAIMALSTLCALLSARNP